MITIIVDYDNDSIRIENYTIKKPLEIFKAPYKGLENRSKSIHMSDITSILNEILNAIAPENDNQFMNVGLATQDEGELHTVGEW